MIKMRDMRIALLREHAPRVTLTIVPQPDLRIDKNTMSALVKLRVDLKELSSEWTEKQKAL